MKLHTVISSPPVQSNNISNRADTFLTNLKTIFSQYPTQRYLTDPEEESLKIILQELDDELASSNYQEFFSSISKEIAELLANDTRYFLLCSSAQCNEVNLTALLLTQPQIDINKANNRASNSLHRACTHGHKEIVQLLLAHPQIDINKAANEGWFPLDFACLKGHKEIVELLLAHPQIDINKADNDGWTPLFCACLKGSKETVELLLAHPKININKATINGATPLDIACRCGYKEIVENLILLPAIDANIHKNDKTPFSMAQEKN